jgi:ribosome-binding factor A
MSKDLKHAKMYFSVIGDEKRIESAHKGLESARGFMKRRIADSLELRSIPDIVFYYDNSLDYGLAIDNLLKKVSDEK